MIMEHIVVLYLITGALAGVLAGLLGIGGGIVVVPVLTMLFRYQHFPSTLTMHMAIGTSLAIMIFTAMSSAYAYYRKRLILWSLFRKFIPGLLLGTVAGSFIAKQFSNEHLTIAFAVFIIVIAIHLFFQRIITTQSDLPNLPILLTIAFIIGTFSGFFGIGGGSMIVPFFMYCRVEMHKATGTSSLCGLPIAIVGTTALMLTGWQSAILDQAPIGTVGFVYWPAAVTVAVTSMLCAPLGTRLAIRLSSRVLKKVFAVMLILTAINLLTS